MEKSSNNTTSTREEVLAEEIYDKYMLEIDGKRYMTKDLFLLAIQEYASIRSSQPSQVVKAEDRAVASSILDKHLTIPLFNDYQRGQILAAISEALNLSEQGEKFTSKAQSEIQAPAPPTPQNDNIQQGECEHPRNVRSYIGEGYLRCNLCGAEFK